MKTPTTISARWAAASIAVASYLPPLVGLALGVGHCDVCRQAWLKLVGIVHGTIIPLAGHSLLRIPRIDADSYIGLGLAIAVQVAWLVGWCCLARQGKAWLVAATVAVLGLSIWFTVILNALIRS